MLVTCKGAFQLGTGPVGEVAATRDFYTSATAVSLASQGWHGVHACQELHPAGDRSLGDRGGVLCLEGGSPEAETATFGVSSSAVGSEPRLTGVP